MLLINNQTVEQILDMKGCMAALETGYRDLIDERAIYRGRYDVFVPNDDPKVYDGRNKTFFFGSYQRWSDRQLGSGTTLNTARPTIGLSELLVTLKNATLVSPIRSIPSCAFTWNHARRPSNLVHSASTVTVCPVTIAAPARRNSITSARAPTTRPGGPCRRSHPPPRQP